MGPLKKAKKKFFLNRSSPLKNMILPTPAEKPLINQPTRRIV